MNTKELKRFYRNNIKYKGFTFRVSGKVRDGSCRLKISEGGQRCLEWALSKHMTETQLVQVAWKAVLAMREDSIAKEFLFCGLPVYHPSIDIRGFVSLHSTGRFEKK